MLCSFTHGNKYNSVYLVKITVANYMKFRITCKTTENSYWISLTTQVTITVFWDITSRSSVDSLLFIHGSIITLTNWRSLKTTTLLSWYTEFQCNTPVHQYARRNNSNCPLSHFTAVIILVTLWHAAPNIQNMWCDAWLRLCGQFVIRLSVWRPKFRARPFHVELLVNKVTIGEVFLQALWFTQQHCSTNASYALICLSLMLYDLSNWTYH